MRVCQLFTEHPRKAGETYCEHLRYACCLGVRLLKCGAAAVVHALCPFWFETYVSDRVVPMAAELRERSQPPLQGVVVD